MANCLPPTVKVCTSLRTVRPSLVVKTFPMPPVEPSPIIKAVPMPDSLHDNSLALHAKLNPIIPRTHAPPAGQLARQGSCAAHVGPVGQALENSQHAGVNRHREGLQVLGSRFGQDNLHVYLSYQALAGESMTLTAGRLLLWASTIVAAVSRRLNANRLDRAAHGVGSST